MINRRSDIDIRKATLTGFPDKPESLPHASDNYNELHESEGDD